MNLRLKDISIWVFAGVLVMIFFWGIWQAGLFDKFFNIPEVIVPSSNVEFILGKEFSLDKSQTALLNGDTNTTLRIVKFINDECPKGAQCIWSGLAVEFELVANNRIFRSSLGVLNDAPYSVRVSKTDYKTFANFIVTK